MKPEHRRDSLSSRLKSGRLNLRFLRRICWVMLAGDILLVCLLFCWVTVRAEREARFMLEGQAILTGLPGSVIDRSGSVTLLLSRGEPSGAGFVLPDTLARWMPLERTGVARQWVFGRERGLRGTLRETTYNISFYEQGRQVQAVCAIGEDLLGLWYLLVVILFVQLFMLLHSIALGSRSIRRTLTPLYEMVEQASDLTAQAAPSWRVDDMAGELQGIDSRKLDRRLSESDAPEELKPLAVAINAMLDRIGAAYEAQARFVSDASHELRTPIAVIQGYINLLDRWGKTDEATLQESIEALKSEIKGMQDMVEQLLFLARGDSDAIPLALETLSLGALCEDVVRDMRVARPDDALCCKESARATVSADRALLKQALRILLDNAVKYGGGQPVTVEVASVGGGLYAVSVSDSGQGIAPQEMKHIFDRFFRSDASRARQTGGAGLGLSIAQWIVRRHGWQLTALSRLGIGTKMSILMPGSADTSLQTAAAADEPPCT